jgi:hypothetical protein
MAFDPENPANPTDLYATFDANDKLNGLIYDSPDEGGFARVNGKWAPLDDSSSPIGSGAGVVFVDPKFIMEFDSRMMYREYIKLDEVQEKFGVDPMFNISWKE